MYCTINDIVEDMGVKVVAELSNDSDPTIVKTSIVENCILSAQEIIDGYLRSIYNLPLKKSHFMLRRIAVDLTKYELYNRRNNVFEDIQTIYKNAIERLEKIQSGVFVLDEGSANDAPTMLAVSKRPPLYQKEL